MVRFNYFLERGVFSRDEATGKYRVDFGGASRSFAERAYEGLGVAVDDCQQDAGCPVRDPPPLFRRCCRASSTSTWRDGW